MSHEDEIRGRVRKGRRTKRLVLKLRPGEVALIDHRDLDGPAAEALADRRLAAVLNGRRSMTGDYPNRGPAVLAEAGIPLLDLESPERFDAIPDGKTVTIGDGAVRVDGEVVSRCDAWSAERIREVSAGAEDRVRTLMLDFVENTLTFMKREPEVIFSGADLPELSTPILHRHVVIVVRGSGSRGDLRTIRSYIEDIRPVVIAVDGGADICISERIRPDIIVGDMDSASDAALCSGAEIVVHAYTDGRAPGGRRAADLSLDYKVLALPGTSEDAALALAYEKGADLIVMVGSHTDLPDFLEKGRKGMASTFLTRLKVGDRLVDAKGVRMLYQGGIRLVHLAYVVGAAVVTAAAVWAVSPFVREVLTMTSMRVFIAMRDFWRTLFG